MPRDLKVGPAPLSSTVTLWPRLTELFNIINLGSPHLKVAMFNGGLVIAQFSTAVPFPLMGKPAPMRQSYAW